MLPQPDPEWRARIERAQNATRGNIIKARVRLQDCVTERLRKAVASGEPEIIEMKGGY
jgi:hypothetical protein